MAATKSGDPKEANKLQTSVNLISKAVINTGIPIVGATQTHGPQQTQKPHGTWHVRYASNDFTRVYRFLDDGSVVHTVPDDKTYNRKLFRRGHTWFIDFRDNDTNRLTIVGDRLYMEHWRGGEIKGFAHDVATGFRVK